jgi:hypothetical protein
LRTKTSTATNTHTAATVVITISSRAIGAPPLSAFAPNASRVGQPDHTLDYGRLDGMARRLLSDKRSVTTSGGIGFR